MNNKIVGIVLIIIGVALALWGYDIYDSVGSQLSKAIGGEVPMKAWAGMVGGAVCLVLGAYQVIKS